MKTLRDYMKEHHPEYISTATSGGVYVCPTTVPDFNHLNLEPLCDGYTFPIYHDICCTACWDQPYTPPNNIEETHSPEPVKTYEDGLNEAWKLQQKLSALTYQQLENAGMSISWRNYSYNEAKSKYDSYTEELIKTGKHNSKLAEAISEIAEDSQ